MTVHSVQGLSLDCKVTLFDCNTPYIDRNFIWTAITRVRELNNIVYFEHPDDEIKRLENSRMLQFLKLKIDFYKRQDMDAKRNIKKETYIDVDWFVNEINCVDRCSLCNTQFYTVLDERNDVMCNISVDRLNNDICHEKDNCQLCVECNRSKR